MQSNDAIVEYYVDEINETHTLKDALATRNKDRPVYTSWNTAVTAACVLADAVADKHSAKAMCILRNSSQDACNSSGYTTSHRLNKIHSEIVIFKKNI